MNEKMKQFLEAVSGDKEFAEKLNQADTETIITLAKEKGFILTEEDLKPADGIQTVSDDEMDAVAGGKKCYCVAGGGGTGSEGEKTCACVLIGLGYYENGDQRCGCAAVGTGARD